jgi:hypothetical protein
MGHLAGKELYKKLQSKIDGYTVRTPWNQALYDLLKELYTDDEALLVVRMPYRPSGLDRVARVAGMDESCWMAFVKRGWCWICGTAAAMSTLSPPWSSASSSSP